jgi:hypothetical protein
MNKAQNAAIVVLSRVFATQFSAKKSSELVQVIFKLFLRRLRVGLCALVPSLHYGTSASIPHAPPRTNFINKQNNADAISIASAL